MNRLNATSYIVAVSLLSLLHQAMAADPAPPERSPSLIYTLTTQSETVTPLGGIVPMVMVAAYAKSHEKFLNALRSVASDGSGDNPLLRPFACIGIAPPQSTCRRLVEAKEGVANNKLLPLLQTEPTRSARVMEMRIIFDGRFFQVPTKLYEVRLTDKNELVIGHHFIATYINTYSLKQHQQDIAAHRSDFAGSIGSKDARMDYWFGGENPRIMTELNRAMDQIASLWAATLLPDATGIFAADDSARGSLPRAKDVIAKDSEKCHAMYPDMLVAKDGGDILWLVFGKNLRDANQFFVMPRCGFDHG